MGLFNFGSKKKEDKQKKANDSAASEKQPSAPTPPKAPKSPGTGGMGVQQQNNDELEIPPLPDTFSGSMDLHPEKLKPPKQEKDPSLLEINSDELDSGTSQNEPSLDQSQTQQPSSDMDTGQPAPEPEMPPPPREFSSRAQEPPSAPSEPKLPKPPQQDEGIQEPDFDKSDIGQGETMQSQEQQPKSPEMDLSDIYQRGNKPGQPLDNLMGELDEQKSSKEEILPPPPIQQDYSQEPKTPADEPEPPAGPEPEPNIEEPTKPLELDTPPVPDKLDLDDIDSLYDDMKKTAPQDMQSSEPPEEASTIESLPQRPTTRQAERTAEPEAKEEINQGIEKLGLREEKQRPKTIPQPSIDLTSTDFNASSDEKRLDDNLFSSQDETSEQGYREEHIPQMENTINVPRQEEERRESPGMEINKKIVMSADGTRPLFLDLMSFKNIVDVLDSFNNETKLAEDTLFRLNDLNDQETKQYKKWQKSLEELERSIISIDKSLFKV
jgi:hypothetical protein